MECFYKTSDSNKYKLIISYLKKEKGCSYSKGSVYSSAGELITEIERNYPEFPFLFIEDHPNGHQYLICGADYQGQTIIELDTKIRKDFLPEEAKDGTGFCWAEYKFDLKSNILIVNGCFWACPYEFRFYDFSDPISAGWPELISDDYTLDDERWPIIESNNIIKCYQSEENEKESRIASIKTFSRNGLKLSLIDEWVSEKEKKIRFDREESTKKYEKWLADFKENDPMYVKMKQLAKDPLLKPEKYISIGITYSGWCPHFNKENEKRMCRRIHEDAQYSIDIEWGCETGPVKLVIYKDNKHLEDKWFEHSVNGIYQAFLYAKSILKL